MTGSPLTRAFDRSTVVFLLLLAAVAIGVPALNLLLPPTSPYQVPTYLVALFGKYICYALLALAIDLIWGYCGILSLGHGAFFALGGYAMGMYLMRQIGTRGVYANPILPDFMVFLNWPELPVYWYGFQHFPYALLMTVLVPGTLAFVFGWFAFRSRVTGVYLSIITQALTFALMLGFFRNNFGFGGNNGLTDFKDILGFNVQAEGTRAALFAISVVALGLGFLICRVIVTSKFGKVLISIRDAESRTRFLGYRVESYKLLVFTLSACMAGIAGALYVPQVGIINPSEFAPANSIEAVIWVAVGGRGTLIGAVLGAIVVNYAKTSFTSGVLAPYWLFLLGGLFVAVTLLLPRGIVGTLDGWLEGRHRGIAHALWRWLHPSSTGADKMRGTKIATELPGRPAARQPVIMISYRRADAAAITGRIYDRLVTRFGKRNVFVDIDSIPIGKDFHEHIARTLRDCDVLLAIMGSKWMGETEDGKTRIHDEEDFVRIEVEQALQGGASVIPVLVDGATMPSSTSLPESLKRLPRLNAAEVTSGRDFDAQIDRLIRAIDRAVADRGQQGQLDLVEAAATTSHSASGPRPGMASAE